MKLIGAFFLGFFLLLLPGQALAGGICNFDKNDISPYLKAESERIENLSLPLDRNREWSEAPVMSEKLTRQMLASTWRAFGYQGKAVKKRVDLNLRQIAADSDFRPHLEGLFPGDISIPEADTPGGLFAFPTSGDYLEWKNYPGWRGDPSRFNPLSNIVAAVGAQISEKKIFAGKGRISVGQSDWVCITNKL